MKELLKEIREKAKACGNKTKEDRARKGAYVDCILAIEKQFAISGVSKSLPSDDEIDSLAETQFGKELSHLKDHLNTRTQLILIAGIKAGAKWFKHEFSQAMFD